MRARSCPQRLSFSLLLSPVLLAGCGPTDYQKPIQEFSDASAVVAASASTYLNGMNVLEQAKALRQLAFEGKPIDLAEIDKITVISPAEIALRTKTLTTLSDYTASLAILASGKSGSTTSADFKSLESTLQQIATDAGSATGKALDNKHFSGVASAAASAVGAVAQLVIDHKAREDIEASVIQNEKSIEELIDLIGGEMQIAYQRQKTTLGDTRIFITQAYAEAIAPPGAEGSARTTISGRLTLADNLTDYRKQDALLLAADPQPAVLKMKAAFAALVQYAHKDHDPKSSAALWKSVQDFIAAAQPLGQAIHDLVTATL